MYKATIIIPCYNKESYIRRSLDSLTEQSRFKEFEIIIVDDCSKDETVHIAREYESRYENMRVIVLDKGSGSPSKPRNTGIKASTADYIIFMDPDDKVINDGYSTLLTKMEEYDSDILIATRIGVTEAGVKVFTDFIDEEFTYVNSDEYRVKLDLMNRRTFILKTIYKKSLIIDNNIWFNEKISTSEDECFDTTCVAYARKITKINDIVYQYTYEAEGSITTSIPMKFYEDLPEIIESLYDSYKLTFDEETTMYKIAGLLQDYYFNRITLLKSTDDVIQAIKIFHDALESFGFEKFDVLTEERKVSFFEDIKNQVYQERIIASYINRIAILEKRHEKLNRTNKRRGRELKQLKKLQNRKIAKPGIWMAKRISRIKG